MLDPAALDRVAEGDRALAAAAERERLDLDVRELGSALRRYCVDEAKGDMGALTRERTNIAETVRRALSHGDAPIARLRAYQLGSFLRELRRWEATGEETDELRQLGGPFLARARYDGWIVGRRLLLDEAVRAAMFKKRWQDLALIHGHGLDLAPAEERALLRFLLLHPPRDLPGEAYGAAAEQRAADASERYRLRKIDEIAAVDPGYPVDLAKGVVYYRLRNYPRAVEAFRHHLEAHPDGAYKLRAQDYLEAALGAALEPP